MKKAVFSLFILIPLLASAQDSVSPINTFLLRKGYQFPDSTKKVSNSQWPDTLYYNTPYKGNLLGSLTIPISFSSIEIAKGNYVVSPTVSLGLGYCWFWGDFIFNENDKIAVDPKIYFGVIGNAGLENNFSFNKLASFLAGGFIGVSTFTLFGGYDVINKSPSLGVGGRIDFYNISQKYLHILGKIKPVRKHRKIAPIITKD